MVGQCALDPIVKGAWSFEYVKRIDLRPSLYKKGDGDPVGLV